MNSINSLILYGNDAVYPLISPWDPSYTFDDDPKKLVQINEQVVKSLVAIGPIAIPKLLTVYFDPYENDIKKEFSLRVLVILNYKKSYELINEALNGRSLNRNILIGATESAAILKYKEMVPRLIKMLGKYKEDYSTLDIAKHITYALGSIGDNTAIPEIEKELSDSDPELRMIAAYALEKIGTVKDLPILLQSTLWIRIET